MPETTCEQLKIPSRLWWNDEEIKNDFEKNEYLYRRFRPDVDYTYDGELSQASFGRSFSPPCNISCNCSSLCKYSTDVLYSIKKEVPHHFKSGVMKAAIRSIKGQPFKYSIQEKSGERWFSGRFDVIHKPEKCMYPHTEILVYNEIDLVTPNEKREVKPNALKLAIRKELAEVFTICHKPDPNFRPPEN
jgi:hypothetical protein